MKKYTRLFRVLTSGESSFPGDRKGRSRLILFCCIIISVLLLPIAMQYLHLLNFREVGTWVHVFFGPYLINTMIVTVLLLLFYFVFNSLSYGCVALIVFCGLFSIADMQKMRILHQPLLPGDLIFFKQALLVTRMYTSGIVIALVLLAVTATELALLRRHLPHVRLPWRARLLAGTVLTGSLLCIAANLRPVIRQCNRHYRIVDEFWSQISNYRKNGTLYAFLMNIETLRVNRPHDYSRQAVDAVLAPYALPPEPGSPPPAIHPDVIIYMNESFWDLTRITSVHPPCDPIPHFHSLIRRSRSLTLYSPVFGGNTCDAEFELFTGMSSRFFPSGVRAYNQFIQRPIPSLVRLFKNNGYRTTAVHTFKRWFWNRGNVYRHLGFDTFISMEDMKDPELKGKYISDAELSRQIISRLQSGDAPQFIFALSMQNHGPYDEHRYDTLDCPVTTGLSAPADREYNTYLQGITDADRSLEQLTRYIRKASRPTVLFFFGDHLPGFSSVYQETGYGKQVRDAHQWAFATRGVWYANFRLPREQDTAISMMFLPPAIARMADLPVPPYYHFLDTLRTRQPTFIRRVEHSAVSSAVTETSPEWLLIYDVLFGKEYSLQYFRVPEPVMILARNTDTLSHAP
ncbi:MAG: LTA synthase family protein [Chitinispirillaceae bacterium]|nr:LTA synthase family protein [Chitinispirillaceae bacterium]